MSLEISEAKISEVSDPSQHNSCAGLFINENNNTVKRSVNYIKDNFKVFDIYNSGSIGIPELEAVNRDPTTKAVDRQAVSFMTNHFDQMANFINGDDDGFAPALKSVSTGDHDSKENYIDLALVASKSSTKDHTITARDINAMTLAYDPVKRATLEKFGQKDKISTLAIGGVLTPVAALMGDGFGFIGSMVGGPLGYGTASAIGATEATATTVLGVVAGSIWGAAVLGAVGYVGYRTYRAYNDIPSASEIEGAFKQRQAMLDSWTCSK